MLWSVEVLQLTTADWGWTAVLPGFGLLAGGASQNVEAARGEIGTLQQSHPHPPQTVPGNHGRSARQDRRVLDHSTH